MQCHIDGRGSCFVEKIQKFLCNIAWSLMFSAVYGIIVKLQRILYSLWKMKNDHTFCYAVNSQLQSSIFLQRNEVIQTYIKVKAWVNCFVTLFIRFIDNRSGMITAYLSLTKTCCNKIHNRILWLPAKYRVRCHGKIVSIKGTGRVSQMF